MMTGISLILDMVAAAIMLIAVIVGVKRGFIKSVIGLVGLIAAAVIAAMFAGPLAATAYEAIVEKPLIQAVETAVANGADTVHATLSEQIAHTVESLPAVLQALLQADASRLQTEGSVLPTAELSQMIVKVLEPLCVTAVQIVLFLLLFIVLLIAVKLAGKLIDRVFSALPVIKQANGLLGAVVGLAQGALLVFVLCFALELYMTCTGADAAITREHLSQTVLVKTFIEWNPFF